MSVHVPYEGPRKRIVTVDGEEWDEQQQRLAFFLDNPVAIGFTEVDWAVICLGIGQMLGAPKKMYDKWKTDLDTYSDIDDPEMAIDAVRFKLHELAKWYQANEKS